LERRSAGLIESVLAGNIRRNQGPARGNSINFLFFSFINIMANSIKQRKASSPPEPSIIHLNSNSMEESKIRQSHDKYVGLVMMTLGIASLVLALSVFMRSTPLLRSSSKYLHPKETSETDTAIGVPLSPLSKLIDIIGSQSVNYGRTTLTGTYWLGEEYKLHETSTSCGHTGIIRFPHVDLSSLLSEEASDFFGMRSQQQTQTTSLLMDPTFSSVIFDEGKPNLLTNQVDSASLTRKGYKPGSLPNQDRSIIVNLVCASEGDPRTSALLMGIFDGHGTRGHEVSHHLALELPKVFTRILREKQITHPMEKLSDATFIEDALTEMFLEVDAKEPVKGSAGSTASVLFYPGSRSKVYIANAGDSTTIICSYSKTTRISTILYQNRKHKPHLSDERQRIENSGGTVMIPPSLLLDDAKETSRVIIPSADDNPFSSLALAMSRSIGDYDGKRVGIIATPEIDVWDVNDHFDHEPQTSTGVSIPLDVAVNSTSVVLANSHNLHLAVFCNIRL
jgi:serine/threonine protein phosphatase PrpC